MTELEVAIVNVSTENSKVELINNSSKEISQFDEVKVALIIDPSEEVDESDESVNNWCPQTLAQTLSFIASIIILIVLMIFCLILIEGLGMLICFVIFRYPPNWRDHQYYISTTLAGLLSWVIIVRMIKVCCFSQR